MKLINRIERAIYSLETMSEELELMRTRDVDSFL